MKHISANIDIEGRPGTIGSASDFNRSVVGSSLTKGSHFSLSKTFTPIIHNRINELV